MSQDSLSVRAPRVHITYDVEVGDDIKKMELPFVGGVLANLSGSREAPLPPLRNRKFVQVDMGNFEDFMAAITPRVSFEVENRLRDDASQLQVQLRFRRMADFEP